MDITKIIEAIQASRVRISDHADEEAEADKLTYEEIYFSVLHGEIIEEYPADRPYPSCLIYGQTFSGDPVHSVWAYTEWLGCLDHSLSARPKLVDQLAREEEAAKMPFQKCPICGGELVEKEVEKLLRGGMHTAVLKVRAEVCLRCGERLYSQETVRRFEEIRATLERQETAEFQPLGQSFQAG